MKPSTSKTAAEGILRWMMSKPVSGIAVLFFLLIAYAGCQKNQITSPQESGSDVIDLKMSNNLTELNLVSDVEEYEPVFIDENLVNAWGLAFSDEGEIWVSSTEKGLATIYNGEGQTLEPPVNIPFNGDPNGGNPTGAVYNPTGTFIMSSTGEKSEFIYSTENGTIVAAAEGVAVTVADRSSFGAIYKGLELATRGGKSFLYATDFFNAKIDVFDDHFNYVQGFPFIDPNIPSGYAPFNVRAIDGQLFVTYAKQLAPDNEDDEAGPGHGYVDIYTMDGQLVKRFASEGELNSPWGIAKAPGPSPTILIGNFGSGQIGIYGIHGNFINYVKSGENPLVIEGLWSIVFPGENLPPGERKRLYFTAGPDEETHGIFGYLTP